MDRAIDEATGHISSIDNTLDALTGYNMHMMRTLEGMSDGEISDTEMEHQAVQTAPEEKTVVPNVQRRQNAANSAHATQVRDVPWNVGVMKYERMLAGSESEVCVDE